MNESSKKVKPPGEVYARTGETKKQQEQWGKVGHFRLTDNCRFSTPELNSALWKGCLVPSSSQILIPNSRNDEWNSDRPKEDGSKYDGPAGMEPDGVIDSNWDEVMPWSCS